MKKILFTINCDKLDLSSALAGEGWERLEITELSSIDHDHVKNNRAILLVSCSDEVKVKDLFASFELRAFNLPTVFLMEEESQELIELCYKNDFTHIFLSSPNQFLLKAHLKYTFQNYELSVKSNGQKWLKNLDPAQFTKKEYQIIEYIAQAPLTELSRDDLQTFIWGEDKNTTNKLDVHICNLRKKLGDYSVVIHTNERGKISLGFAEPLKPR